MLKICAIGNSHIACFKTGWQLIAKYYPEVELTIYPFHGLFYNEFTPVPEEGILRTDKELIRKRFVHLLGGDGHISFSEFDRCLIVGGTRPFAASLKRFSTQVRQATIIDWFEASHMNLLIQKIRALTDIPIDMTLNPLLAFRDPAQNRVNDADFKGMIEVLTPHLLANRNTYIIAQPDHTIDGGFASKLAYATGERMTNASALPDAPQVMEDDLMHMNSAFGALMLAKILAAQGIIPNDLMLPEPDGHIPLAKRHRPPKMIRPETL